jgi:hypothetical protein
LRHACTVQQCGAIGGDPGRLQAIPDVVGHRVLPHAAQQGRERWICFRLPLDVRDHEVAMEAKELFDGAGGETSPRRHGLIERPDGKDELPCFHWIFANQVIDLLEGPEERVVFGSMLRRRLEGDPGLCQFVALVAGHEVTSR